MSEIIGGFIAGVLMCPFLMYGFVWIVECYDEWRLQRADGCCDRWRLCGRTWLVEVGD